ncbi:hypothetical protein [Paenibacillus sp. y28]|uniref:hypothetical protein n=1 Tax=Paenibacillus sp. y28 TaxID=3129110 RepID=UPI0030166D43
MRKNRLSCRLNAAFRWTETSDYYVSTPSVMARSMLFYVQEIGCFRTLPGYFTERASLDSF